MGAFWVRPHERGELALAKRIARAAENTEELSLSARERDGQLRQAGVIREDGCVQEHADGRNADPQPPTAARAILAGLDGERFGWTQSKLVPVWVVAGPNGLARPKTNCSPCGRLEISDYLAQTVEEASRASIRGRIHAPSTQTTRLVVAGWVA